MIAPHDQLSLAIGKRGQNARLASRLIGWNIDIRSNQEGAGESGVPAADDEGADESGVPPAETEAGAEES